MRRASLFAALSLLTLAPFVPAQRARLLPVGRAATGGDDAWYARVADMNVDGVPDVVTTRNVFSSGTGGNPGLVVLLGQRGGSDDGSFSAPLFKASNRQIWFDIGDLDGDGVPDVVSGRPAPGGTPNHIPVVQSYLGVGDGTLQDPFESQVEAVKGKVLDKIALADFNEDGDLDVAVISIAFQHHVCPALGHGDGTFGVFGDPFLEAFYDFTVGDVDSDGHVDLVSGNGPTTCLGHGDGTFADPVLSGISSAWLQSVQLADLDGTGALDFEGRSGNYVYLRPNVGGGLFGALTTLISPLQTLSDVRVADFDADGLPDLLGVVAEYESWTTPLPGSLALWRGTGPLQFAGPETCVVGGSPQSLEVADLDGDGAQDLILGQHSNDEDPNPSATGVGLAFGRQTLTPDVALADVFAGPQLSDLPDFAQRLAAGDLDADGDTDVLALLTNDSTGSRLQSLPGVGGALGAALPATLAAPGLPGVPIAPTRLLLGDFDDDGADDLLLTGTGPDGLLAALSLGDGQHFGPPVSFGDGDVDDVQIADLDGDGALDVVVARRVPGLVSAHLGSGDGQFAAAVATPVATYSDRLAAADLGGDGLPDVVATSSLFNDASILHGTGDGHFTLVQTMPALERPSVVLLADLGHDGVLELVTLAQKDNLQMVVRAGLGEAFGPPQQTLLEKPGTALRAGDVDRDGRQDLLVLETIRNSFVLYAGDGANGLQPPVSFFAVRQTSDVVLADVDADGFPDLVAAGRKPGAQTDEVLVYPGQSRAFETLGYATGEPAPKLVGAGTPAPDEEVSFTASGVAAGAQGFLILGLDTLHAPFNGGTLVPVPTAAVPMRPDVPLAGRWPALPAGAAIYAQAWFVAGGEVVGTNAIVALTE